MRVNEIEDLLRKWDGVGKKHFPSGTTYFGPIRGEPGRNGWLHQIFRPLEKEVLDRFSIENPFHAKYEYSRQLYDCNGAIFFLKTFFLFGLRVDSDMDSRDLPWDLVMSNIGKRDIALEFGGVVIGGAQLEECYIDYVENGENEIVAFNESKGSVLFKWMNFDKFLRSEIDRFNNAFSENGTPPENFELSNYSAAAKEPR